MIHNKSTHHASALFLTLVLLSITTYGRDSLLVWSDEFGGSGLPDSTVWGYEVGYLRNSEAQYYTRARSENVRRENGSLIIEARLDNFENHPITAASIITQWKSSWLYGRVDVRAKIPAGRGAWPAIWLLPEASPYGYWPAGGEIDIMENVGFEPSIIHGTVHTRAYNHVDGTARGQWVTVSDPQNTFHVYSTIWSPDSVLMLVDNIRYFAFANEGTWQAWPFDQRFYLILNLAIGGSWGGQQGIDSTKFPFRFEIDYARVYKMDLGTGPYSLSTTVSGQGTITRSPAKSSYSELEKVALNAVPADGWELGEWQGALAGRKTIDTLIMDHNLQIKALFLPRGERITNGTFATGTQGWFFWNDASNAATMDASTGAACVRVPTVAADWTAQLDWTGLSCIAGEVYDLSFTASATRARPLTATIRQNHANYLLLTPSATINITTQSATYSCRFVINQSDPVARLEFDFGQDTARTCIDNVSLRLISTTGLFAGSHRRIVQTMILRKTFANGGVALRRVRNGTSEWFDLRGSRIILKRSRF